MANTGQATGWITPTLLEQSNTDGKWQLKKRDVESSRLAEDSAPGEALADWIKAYGKVGNPLDMVQVSFTPPNGKLKRWNVSPPLETEKSGWDRALDLFLPMIQTPENRQALMLTVTKACRPILEAAIAPTVKATVVETLSELLTDEPDEPTNEVDESSNRQLLSGGVSTLAS